MSSTKRRPLAEGASHIARVRLTNIAALVAVGATGVVVGGAIPLAAMQLGELSDSGATLIGSAFGAAAAVVAAIVAIWATQRAEQARLREYVDACLQDILGAVSAVYERQKSFPDAIELTSTEWGELRRLSVALQHACLVGEKRLGRIDAVAYKLDGQTLRWLLEVEALIPAGIALSSALQEHASQQSVRLYGGPLPISLKKDAAMLAAMLKAFQAVIRSK